MKKIALLGNPNCGKTTLFNTLTGSTAHVGNWPGVTVDKREGSYRKLEEEIDIVDLPGIYSLSPYTSEEIISRNFIIDEKPDCVINVIDSTNLERNLYLTTQLLEIDVPVVIALNMSDVVKKNGDYIDAESLSNRLNVPVVEISALKNTNTDKLMKTALETAKRSRVGTSIIGRAEIAHLINDVRIAFKGQGVENPLFHAVKLVELDEIEIKNHPDLIGMVEEFKKTFSDDTFGDDFESIISEARYKYIEKNYSSVFKKHKNQNGKKEDKTLSDKVDRVLTHPLWSIPILLVTMFLIFHFTFSSDLFFMGSMGLTIENEGWINFFTGMGYEGEPLEGIPSLGVFLQNWMGWFSGQLINGFSWMFNGFENFGELTNDAWYSRLLVEGVLTGLDSVLSFIPQILLLFLFISILEDSGYMARIAFILDRTFRKMGLSGKAFIPMLTGFGCSVPAIMATRTLENETAKNRTIRLITCFSCGAKAPLWALLAAVASFCGYGYADIFVFTIYLGGIFLAIIMALLMKVFSSENDVPPFIMELPSYHMPQAHNLMAHLWDKLKHYVIKAGTIIAASLVVIWALQSYGVENGALCLVEDMSNSFLAYIGKGIRYLFYPLGWAMNDDGWKYSVAAITGLVAKEQVIGTMALLFKVDEDALVSGLTSLSSVGLYAFAVFNLITLPCMAAIATAKAEQTRKEFIKTLCFWFGLSYVSSGLVYWIGTLYEISFVIGILTSLGIVALFVSVILLRNKKSKRLMGAKI